MTHDTKEQPRKLAGTPKSTGGQYDYKLHTEPTVELKEYDDNPEGGFQGEALLKLALSLARQTGNRVGMSDAAIEDIAQEAVLSALTTQQKKREPITGGYMRTVTRSLVGRTIDTHKRHEDSKAFKMAKERFSALEAEGVEVTKTVRDQVSKEIRDGWHDPRHKPSEDFLDVPVYVSASAIPNFDDSFAAVDNSGAEGSATAHNLADKVEDRELDKKAARLLFWNAIAAENGVPQVERGLITRRDAKQAKDAIGKDLHAIAERHQNGTIGAAESAALFRPFSTLSAAEKDATVALLLDRDAKVAHVMWTAALETASAPQDA